MAGETVIRTGCKINLFLNILARRADGYHELSTLFYPLSEPADELRLETVSGSDFELECSEQGIPAKENLVYKAWLAFGQASGYAPGLRGFLKKRVPSGAGLGGGSADAAGILSWLNGQAGKQALNPLRLQALAAKLGADVPFFLQSQPAWAQGIGEELTPAKVDLSGFSLILLCPSVKVNTGFAYGEWDRLRDCGKIGSGLLTSAAGQNTAPFSQDGLCVANSFEQVVFPLYPELGRLKEFLLELGAAAAALSGSGASLFGLFRGEVPSGAGKRLEALGLPFFVRRF